MKYLTKEWYELMQKCYRASGYERIADKAYSDEDIAKLHDKKLQETVSSFTNYTENGGESSFSTQDIAERFELLYRQRSEELNHCLPVWLNSEVDRHLIALFMLPASAYDRLKKEDGENNAEFDRMNEIAQKALAVEKTKIPEERSNGFSFHDGLVVSLKNGGDDIILTVQIDSLQACDGLEYAKITFEEGNVIQMDENLKIGFQQLGEQNAEEGNICWLHEELYKTENGYEAHMLLVQNGLAYLTIKCSDIKIEYADKIDE